MLEDLDKFSDTKRSREIEAELAEFRAKVERGEVPPPPPWKPDFPDPFGGNWDFFTISPPTEKPRRPDLSEQEIDPARRVRSEIDTILASQPAVSVPDEHLHRHIVDEIERRIYGTRLQAAERLAFLEMAAQEVRQLMIERAEAAPKENLPAALDDTARAHALSATTVVSAGRDAQRVLRQMQILDSLPTDDARYYRLARLAGRTTEEIAELLRRPHDEVLDRTKWAITEVTLED